MMHVGCTALNTATNGITCCMLAQKPSACPLLLTTACTHPPSPNLIWVENIWAWAERELKTNEGHTGNIQDLQRELKAVFKSAKSSRIMPKA